MADRRGPPSCRSDVDGDERGEIPQRGGQPDVLAGRSLFRDVQRVPGGHLLLLGPDGAAVERYEPVSYSRVDLREQAPVVRAALAEAVAARIEDRPVSADLAGLDSTGLGTGGLTYSTVASCRCC
ncbi:hypothetical protein ACFU93_44200 [Streptomyces sp. NPDC057611]|uniref:hypothetical protein n=1 Tax=Streptomyces sp. NPDC057611 TaxID=3346182 RepID=UPI0036AFEB22